MNPPILTNPPPRKRRGRPWVWIVFLLVLLTRFVWLPDLWQMPEDRRQGINFPMRMGPGPRFRGASNPGMKPQHELPKDLWRLEIQIAADDLDELRGYYWNGFDGRKAERPEVTATVREGGIVYTNVAIHPKGSAGSFRPIDDKPALTLNFSKNAKGQKFHGWNKISLNNSVQDPSFLAEAISRELFNAAGIPTPEAKHATVVLNGRDLGMYVVLEGYGRGFIKRHFDNADGNLYDGGFCQEVSTRLDANSGAHPEDRSDLKRLVDACAVSDKAQLWKRLSEVLDMDEFIKMIAMEVMTCHWDGYALNRNNYRVFHDLSTDRMLFLPHGMDQMFGTFRSSPSSTILPRMQGIVARAVMSTGEGRRKYLATVANLRTNVFVPEKIIARVEEISQTITPTLAAYNPGLATAHKRNAEALCARIRERAESISKQLDRPRTPAKFNEDGVMSLSNWSPRVNPNQADGVSLKKVEREGREWLGIRTKSATSASWRTVVAIESGDYAFEGTVHATGLSGAGGVTLRLSGFQTAAVKVPQNTPAPLRHEFRVQEPVAEVELICELRGANSSADFDIQSLKLVRLQDGAATVNEKPSPPTRRLERIGE